MSETTDLLEQLVAIESSNASMPAGKGEAALAAFVAEYGRQLGAEVTLDEVLPGRPNVWLRLPASTLAAAGQGGEPATTAAPSRPRRLLLDVHLDTVPLEPMPDALTPRRDGARLWGRGACDTKSSLAAALSALRRVAGRSRPRAREVVLLGTVDEEYLKRGVAHAVARGLVADAAIVGEPTSLQPVIAHKGAVRWRLVTQGKAAHTSRPEQGSNAIYQMVEVIRTLRERLEPLLATRTHPLLTPPTLTVGRIEGGVGVNIVPERCVIEIDRRTLPSEPPDEVLAEVDALLAELMAARPDIRVVREAPFLAERGLETPADASLVVALQRACREVLGNSAALEPAGVPYGTDATHLWGSAGIPCVVFGPGDIAQAHSSEEWVELDQVERAADIFERVVEEFITGGW